MDKLLQKKFKKIILTNLILAILFIKFKSIILNITYFEEVNYLVLIIYGIINYLFFIKKSNLWNHSKFFIPFSVVIAFLFAIVHFLYIIFFVGYTEGYVMSLFFISLPIATGKFAIIFFIGTLLGAVLREIYDRINLIYHKRSLN